MTDSGGSFFASPEEAVTAVSALLRAGRFTELAAHYDLTGSAVPRAELESGAYFRRSTPGGHPAESFRRPFVPGSRHVGHAPGERPDEFRVDVALVIPQGAGAPDQVGLRSFDMRRSTRGWQLLPDGEADGPRADGSA